MGLLHGFKNQYKLYDEFGRVVATVYPLNINVNNVASIYQCHQKLKGNLTDDELAQYKRDNNLFRDYELLGMIQDEQP